MLSSHKLTADHKGLWEKGKERQRNMGDGKAFKGRWEKTRKTIEYNSKGRWKKTKKDKGRENKMGQGKGRDEKAMEERRRQRTRSQRKRDNGTRKRMLCNLEKWIWSGEGGEGGGKGRLKLL
jgi:hypothetical protein